MLVTVGKIVWIFRNRTGKRVSNEAVNYMSEYTGVYGMTIFDLTDIIKKLDKLEHDTITLEDVKKIMK